MKLPILIGVLLIIAIFGHAQTPSFKKYLNSYKVDTKNQIKSLDEISSIENKMTLNEALEFVYDHDSSRLYCSEEIVDLMTEKVSGVSRNLYLPEKCILYQNEKYFLMAYRSYLCQNPKDCFKVYLTFAIISRDYKPMDKLEILLNSCDAPEIMGLLNPSKGLLFLIGFLKSRSSIDASIVGVNKSTLKFVVLKKSENIKGDFSNYTKTIKNLGWENVFNPQ